MEKHHPTEARLVYLGSAMGHHILLVAARESQFVQTQERHEAKKGEVRDNT
jgi:hypothetical protein